MSHVLEFGGFRLYPQQRLLLENDTAIEVPGRAMDILIALAERAGEVVSKDELLASAWPGCVCRLRQSVQVEKVSAESLPKAGIFPIGAGDFRQILALVALFWSLETSRRTQENPYFTGFL